MNIALEWLMRLEYQEHHALKAVAKYYRHRLPESLGKQLNDPGHLVHVKFFMATESAQASLFFTTISQSNIKTLALIMDVLECPVVFLVK